ATIFSWFIYFLSFVFVLIPNYFPLWLQYVFCLLSPFYSFKQLFRLLLLINANLGVANKGYFTQIYSHTLIYLYVCLLMLTSILLMWILTWYIEQVNPGIYGIRKPWTFPFQNIKNIRKQKKRSNSVDMKMINNDNEMEVKDEHPTVKVKNLTKIYGTYFDKHTVVDNITFNLYQSQIQGLIGHNGAGKHKRHVFYCYYSYFP
ncbi:unnamed protein product, partial [Didymodactylos carnosus]